MTTQFYAKLPKKVTDLGLRLRKVMESGEVDNKAVVEIYFVKYWPEFSSWWYKVMGEHIEFVTFALAPHNCEFFTEWVFKNYPDIADKVVEDLNKAGW